MFHLTAERKRMYWWTYKGLAPESDSYANLRLAGRSFDLTIHELLCFLFFNPVGPEKYAVWDRLSWDSSVSVRLAVTMSGILHRADLKWRATDSAYCVRLWARKGLERLYEAGGRDPQADLTRAYFNACAVLTYDGCEVPVSAADLKFFISQLPVTNRLLREGCFAESLMASPAARDEELRKTVLTTCGLTEGLVRCVWCFGTDEDRRCLLENPEARGQVSFSPEELEAMRESSPRAYRFLTEKGVLADILDARAVRAAKEMSPWTENSGKSGESVTRRTEESRSGKAPAAKDCDSDEVVWRSGTDATVAKAGAVTMNWLGCRGALDDTSLLFFAGSLPNDIAGEGRSFFEALAAGDLPQVQRLAAKRLRALRRSGTRPARVPAGSDRDSAWVEMGGERFYCDPAWFPPVVTQSACGLSALADAFRGRLPAEPFLLQYRLVRKWVAADPRITRAEALMLKHETDEEVLEVLCDNTAFWAALTPEEILDFAEFDPGRQLECMTALSDEAVLKAVCLEFLKSNDPEVKEMAAKRLARPGKLEKLWE